MSDQKPPKCPECGNPLSIAVDKDDDTGEIMIEFWCEGEGEDVFDFVILTGLQEEELEKLRYEKKRKEMRWQKMI